mmetsp:Transcript_13106/g.29755  ORF Transcript_13106/g.29755 Transcript_13106/m.29755 type:complete len:308 (-) Transcript_13106:15-938(-)
MQAYAGNQYGATIAPPDQARLPLKRRRRTNVLSLVASLLVPWAAFAITFGVVSFSIHYQHPQLCSFVVAIGAIVILVTGTMALQAHWQKRARDTPREPTWYMFVSLTLLLAWVLALILGNANYSTHMRPYYDVTNLNTYAGVDPAKARGQTLLDAGRVMFTRTARLDISKSFGFKNGNTYCVVPVVSSEERLASYDFWAVGVNCCSGNKPDFQCSNYDSPRAHAGLRLMSDGERENFRLAVEQAEAAHGIRAQSPLFFYWTEDPIGETNGYQDRGFKFYILAVLLFFAVQLFLVVMSAVGFVQFASR